MTLSDKYINETHESLLEKCVEFHECKGALPHSLNVDNVENAENEKLYVLSDYSCIIRNDSGHNESVYYIYDLNEEYLKIMGYEYD